MKVNKVSAFRVKRGLRRVSGAESQVVGLTPQRIDEWKTDTMKTFILRPAKPVETEISHGRRWGVSCYCPRFQRHCGAPISDPACFWPFCGLAGSETGAPGAGCTRGDALFYRPPSGANVTLDSNIETGGIERVDFLVG